MGREEHDLQSVGTTETARGISFVVSGSGLEKMYKKQRKMRGIVCDIVDKKCPYPELYEAVFDVLGLIGKPCFSSFQQG